MGDLLRLRSRGVRRRDARSLGRRRAASRSSGRTRERAVARRLVGLERSLPRHRDGALWARARATRLGGGRSSRRARVHARAGRLRAARGRCCSIAGVPFGSGRCSSSPLVVAVAARRGRRPSGRACPTHGARPRAAAALRRCRRDRRYGRAARGALPRRAPLRALLVGRLGVLGAEGEGDLLLRRARRGVLHDAARSVATHRSCRCSTRPHSMRWEASTS